MVKTRRHEIILDPDEPKYFHIRGITEKINDVIEMIGLKDKISPQYERKNGGKFNETRNFEETQHLQGLSHYKPMEKIGHIQMKISQERKDEFIKIIEEKYTIVWGIKNWSLFLDNRCEGLDKTKNMYCDVKNKYPIFVISYLRSNDKYGKTCKWLEKMGIPYTVVVEEDQENDYKEWLETKNGMGEILTMDKEFKNFQHQFGNYGSIPVRNFIHNYIINRGDKKYWLLDDNIDGYKWVDKYTKVNCNSPLCFRMIEDWSDEIKNMYLSGHQYSSFVPEIDLKQKVLYGTRVFSSMLISRDIPKLNDDNDIWRGKYNEDVDLSLRLLTKGLPTANFCNITSVKCSTGSCKGGNEEIYEEGGDIRGGKTKTDEIVERWEGYVKEVDRFGRPHHDIKNEWINQWKNNELDYEEFDGTIQYDIYYK